MAEQAGGVGQRFYSKYYADKDPNPRTIVKVVAGEDEEVLEQLAALYGAMTSGGVFRAASIKTADGKVDKPSLLVDVENLTDENYRGISWGMDAPGRGVSMRYGVRWTEELLIKALFTFHPELANEGLLYDGSEERRSNYSLEGGDVHPLRHDLVVIGQQNS